MTSPDQRARGQDRDDAIEIVEAASKGGRIVQVDRDKRIEELRRAQTMQDIDMQVRDLRAPQAWTAPQPAASAPTVTAGQQPTPYAQNAQPGQQPWPLVNYGPAQGSTVDVATVVGTTGRRIGGIIAAIVLLSVVIPIAGVVIALVSARESFEGTFAQPTDETTYLPGQEPGEGGINMHTASGYQDFVAAVEEETGSTMVFDVTLYPRYAVLEVPVKAGTSRYERYYYDGELSAQDSRGTSSTTPFDLEELRPDLVIRLLKKVRNLVEAPTSWYAYADDLSGEPRVTAYASNEYSESEFIQATFDGKITYDSTKQ